MCVQWYEHRELYHQLGSSGANSQTKCVDIQSGLSCKLSFFLNPQTQQTFGWVSSPKCSSSPSNVSVSKPWQSHFQAHSPSPPTHPARPLTHPTHQANFLSIPEWLRVTTRKSRCLHLVNRCSTSGAPLASGRGLGMRLEPPCIFVQW